MARLIYSTIQSLDGYIEDADGRFDWSEPDEEVHQLFNDLLRPVGTYLYGRRMYETMAVWETMTGKSPASRDFAEVWRAAEKVVYSTTLDAVNSARTQLERSFEPDAVRALKASSESALSVGGPGLAAEAIRGGLVDEVQLFLTPIVVGGGKPALPEGVRVALELLAERRFGNGVVFLRYGTRGAP